MKKGLIIINAYADFPAIFAQADSIKAELEKLGIKVDVKRNDFFPVITEGSDLRLQTDRYDFCVYLDKDKYVSAMLEKAGMRLFNSHDPIRICDDKMETYPDDGPLFCSLQRARFLHNEKIFSGFFHHGSFGPSKTYNK